MKATFPANCIYRALKMSKDNVRFHEPVDPTTRFQSEIKDGAEPPISYKAESRGGDWQVEKDKTGELSEQMEKGRQIGEKEAKAQEQDDEDYTPGT